jgi:tetratricopeptide (TPR) repeat protein|tara:strand:- start:24 stop:590 length:567 start_codon:yes stop_codon:yes gene_type:complete
MKSEFEKEILGEYDKFSISENLIEKESLRKSIRAKILAQTELNSLDYQLLGLIDTESDNWRNNSEKIIENLKKAVEKDKSNFMAQLYLAHIYHDIGNLELALKNYLKVDTKALKKFQLWKYVKLIEQIGFCTYKLGNETAGIVFFEKVLNWYIKTPENELARPSELLECLPKNHRIVIEIKKIEDYLE